MSGSALRVDVGGQISNRFIYAFLLINTRIVSYFDRLISLELSVPARQDPIIHARWVRFIDMLSGPVGGRH